MNSYTKEDFPSEPEDLLDHSTSGDLCLRVITSVTGSSILCFVPEENTDSFLVVLPCRLLSSDDKFMVEPYMDVPFLRMMKSCTVSIVPSFGDFEFYYLDYLIKNGERLYEPLEEMIIHFRERFDYLVKKKAGKLTAPQSALEFEDTIETESPSEKEEFTMLVIPDSKYKH